MELWEKRDELMWDSGSLLAVVASELANGSVNRRPWLSVFISGSLLDLLKFGLANTVSFCVRAEEAGIDQDGSLDAMGYLVLRALKEFSTEKVKSVLGDFMDAPKKDKEIIQGLVLRPVFSRLMVGVTDACSRDCECVSTDVRQLSEDEAEHYWDRLQNPKINADQKKPKEFLILQRADRPCKVGFNIDRKHGCPLIETDDFDEKSRLDLGGITAILQEVIQQRSQQGRS